MWSDETVGVEGSTWHRGCTWRVLSTVATLGEGIRGPLECKNLEPHYAPSIRVVPSPLIRGEIVHLITWGEGRPFPLPLV